MLPKIKILDWDDVPERYKFRAQDADGILYYYVGKPHLDEDCFAAGNLGFIKGIETVLNPDWKDSLEQRPVPDPIVDAEVVFKFKNFIMTGKIKKEDVTGDFYVCSIDSMTWYGKVDEIQWKYLKDIEL